LLPLLGLATADLAVSSPEIRPRTPAQIELIEKYRNDVLPKLDTRSGWCEGFKAFGNLIMTDQSNCGTVQKCADTMQLYFQEFVMNDQTNNFVTLIFCGKEEDTRPDDTRGNVWWYDGEYPNGDREYWICDQTSKLVTNEETYACGRRGMYVRGIEIDISISLQASPDWRHTKWDITHDVSISKDFNGEAVRGNPMFDYTPRKDCCNTKNRCCQNTCRCGTEHGLKEGECFNGENKQVTDMTTECAQPNPCGKADEMHKLWGASIYEQLYGKKTHVLMTICQKDGYWKDEHASCTDPRNAQYCKEESWSAIGADQMGFALFEPTQFSNSIWDHIEWDKAPRDQLRGDGHVMGDGDGYDPYRFSQCCTTVTIAPQI